MEIRFQPNWLVVVRRFYKRKVVPTPNPPTRTSRLASDLSPSAVVAAKHICQRSLWQKSFAATPTLKVTLSLLQSRLHRVRDKLESAAVELAETTTCRLHHYPTAHGRAFAAGVACSERPTSNALWRRFGSAPYGRRAETPPQNK